MRALLAIGTVLGLFLAGCMAPNAPPGSTDAPGPGTLDPTKADSVAEDAALAAALEELRGAPPPVDENGNPLPPLQMTPWAEAVGLSASVTTKKRDDTANLAAIYPMQFPDGAMIFGMRTGETSSVMMVREDKIGHVTHHIRHANKHWFASFKSPEGLYVVNWGHYFEPRSFEKDGHPKGCGCFKGVIGFIDLLPSLGEESRSHTQFHWGPGWQEIMPLTVGGHYYLLAHKPDGTMAADHFNPSAPRWERLSEAYKSNWGSRFDRFMPFTLGSEQFVLAYSTASGEYMIMHASQRDGNAKRLAFEPVAGGWWSKGWSSFVPMGATREGFTYLAYNRLTKTLAVDSIALDLRVTTLARESWDAEALGDPETIAAMPSTPARAEFAMGSSHGHVRFVTVVARPDPSRYLAPGDSIRLVAGAGISALPDGTVARGDGPTGADAFVLERVPGSNATGPLRYNEPVRLKTVNGYLSWDAKGNVRSDAAAGASGIVWRVKQVGDPAGNDPILRRFGAYIDTERGSALWVTSGDSLDTKARWPWERYGHTQTFHVA